MSFCSYKSHIQAGDTVLVYLTPKQMYSLKVKEDEVYQTRFGALKHNDVIGKPYGSKVLCSRGFVHILDMTPELWTLTLPHRTQILYGPDISFILIQLQLKPGSTVIEAGTGSGSLSHCIARTIAPDGMLYTHDFHEDRANTAREEFKDHGLDSIITVQHRDVCSNGFDVDKLVDAVFLDLPHPWEAIESAHGQLKSGGRICCFSPCIEQVQRSCQTMSNLNFMDIETYECVLRPYEIRNWKLKTFNAHKTKSQCPSGDSNDQPEPEESSIKSEGENGENGDGDCPNAPKRIKLDPAVPTTDKSDATEEDTNYTIAYMNTEVAGHTGFLTFATKFAADN